MTEASIVTDLGNYSGSDEDLGAEAKRIRQKHLQERRKLKKLGTLIPIDTENDEVDAAASRSQANALPLRTKHGQSKSERKQINKVYYPLAEWLSASTTATDIELDNETPRISKSVGFGVVEQSTFVKDNADQSTAVDDPGPGPSGTQSETAAQRTRNFADRDGSDASLQLLKEMLSELDDDKNKK